MAVNARQCLLPVYFLIDDGYDGRKRMSRDNLIDLYDFPETAAAAAPGAPAAAHRQPARNVINLLDADDGDDSSDEPQPYSPSPHRRKEKKRYKTDPNEALAPSKKKRRHAPPVDPPAAAAPPGPELQILEIFPDADVATLQTLLHQFQNNVPMVLSYMADHPYQKSEQKPAPGRDSLVHRLPSENNPWKYDYTSTESFAITGDYFRQATDQLLADFAFLSQHGAKNILQKHKFHYAVAHEKILTAIKGGTSGAGGGEDAQYDRVLSALECGSKSSRSTRRLQPDQMERLQSCCTSHFRKAPTLKNFRKGGSKALVSNEILLEEIRFVKTKLREWMDAQRLKREQKVAQERAQQQGTALECGCCFDSYPFEAMVACRDEGHLFCTDCLKLYAEQQVFGQGNLGIDKKTKQPALELLCCYGGGDGCSSGFHRGCLEKALPPKTLQKYDEVQFQISIERAGLSHNVCSCPKCGFQADVPETQRVFQCPVAECGYASCRDCGEAAHIPLRSVVGLLVSFFSRKCCDFSGQTEIFVSGSNIFRLFPIQQVRGSRKGSGDKGTPYGRGSNLPGSHPQVSKVQKSHHEKRRLQ